MQECPVVLGRRSAMPGNLLCMCAGYPALKQLNSPCISGERQFQTCTAGGFSRASILLMTFASVCQRVRRTWDLCSHAEVGVCIRVRSFHIDLMHFHECARCSRA